MKKVEGGASFMRDGRIKLGILLEQHEWEALKKRADEGRRDPSDMAAFFVAQGLGLLDPKEVSLDDRTDRNG